MKYDFTITEVDPKTLTVYWERNPREHYNPEELAGIILLNKEFEGEVWYNLRTGSEWDGSPHFGEKVLLKGHRSILAVAHIEEVFPEFFTELFPNGTVPAREFVGLPESEENRYRDDHTAAKPLSTPLEYFFQMENMVKNGRSMLEVAVAMTPVFGMKNSNSKHYREALKERDYQARCQHLRSAWMGQIRIPFWILEMPEIVRENYVQTLRSNTENPIPKVDSTRVVELHKALVKARKEQEKALKDEGKELPVIDRDNPGEYWQAQWDAYIAQDSSNEPPAKKKVRTTKDVEAYAPKVRSDVYKNIFQKWLKGEEAPLGDGDDLCYVAETVKAFFPSFWNTEVKEKFRDALKLKAEAKAKAEAEAELRKAEDEATAEAEKAAEPEVRKEKSKVKKS